MMYAFILLFGIVDVIISDFAKTYNGKIEMHYILHGGSNIFKCRCLKLQQYFFVIFFCYCLSFFNQVIRLSSSLVTCLHQLQQHSFDILGSHAFTICVHDIIFQCYGSASIFESSWSTLLISVSIPPYQRLDVIHLCAVTSIYIVLYYKHWVYQTNQRFFYSILAWLSSTSLFLDCNLILHTVIREYYCDVFSFNISFYHLGTFVMINRANTCFCNSNLQIKKRVYQQDRYIWKLLKYHPFIYW
jgi:hypothetical protein